MLQSHIGNDAACQNFTPVSPRFAMARNTMVNGKPDLIILYNNLFFCIVTVNYYLFHPETVQKVEKLVVSTCTCRSNLNVLSS